MTENEFVNAVPYAHVPFLMFRCAVIEVCMKEILVLLKREVS